MRLRHAGVAVVCAAALVVGLLAPASADDSFDQRPEAGRAPFTKGDRVTHPSLGEGLVRACDGNGPDAKVTVVFPGIGEKRVIAKFLRRG